MRQNKYLNNIARQDHRAIKRIIIAGIETMHMIRKRQLNRPAGQTMSAAQQFYSLAV